MASSYCKGSPAAHGSLCLRVHTLAFDGAGRGEEPARKPGVYSLAHHSTVTSQREAVLGMLTKPFGPAGSLSRILRVETPQKGVAVSYQFLSEPRLELG